jgi:hypothetical protein
MKKRRNAAVGKKFGSTFFFSFVIRLKILNKRARQHDIYYYLVSCTILYDILTGEKKRISFCGFIGKTGNPFQVKQQRKVVVRLWYVRLTYVCSLSRLPLMLLSGY